MAGVDLATNIAAATSDFDFSTPSSTSSSDISRFTGLSSPSNNVNSDIPSSDSDSLSAGAIAGLVVGGLFVLFIIVVWIWACLFGSFKGCGKLCKRRRDKKEAQLRQKMFPMNMQKGWYTGGQQEYQALPQQLVLDGGGHGGTPEMMGNIPGDKGTNFHRAEMMGDVPGGEYRESATTQSRKWA